MPTKQAILDNVAEYSPTELVDYIMSDVVSYEELCEEPEFSHNARKQVKTILDRKEIEKQNTQSDEDDWKNACALNTIEAYEQYLKSYPEGKHRSEAREAKKRIADAPSIDDVISLAWSQVNKNDINALENFISTYPDSDYVIQAKERINAIGRTGFIPSAINRLKKDLDGEMDPNVIIETIRGYLNRNEITTDQLYDEIRINHNLFTALTIDRLERAGIIDFDQLKNKSDINDKFLEFICNNDVNSAVVNVDSIPIESIGPKTTEFYFWGIPSSGKTCALGAIMSEARHGNYIEFAEPNNECQGYQYMTVLSQIFEGGSEVFKLPEGTQTDAIFEMGYTFKRQKKDYPVTFIDLAGETIESMYRQDAKLPLSPKKQAGLDMACKLLTGNAKINRKIHFFVLEYNGHTKRYKELTQDTLLTGALTYIKKTGIFRRETDAVFLLVTKSDLTGASSQEERNLILGDYIKTHYRQFYNGLKNICQTYEINAGNVDIIPFSLGDVCFQNLCLFNNTTASTVVEIIIEHAKGFKTSKFNKIFKG